MLPPSLRYHHKNCPCYRSKCLTHCFIVIPLSYHSLFCSANIFWHLVNSNVAVSELRLMKFNCLYVWNNDLYVTVFVRTGCNCCGCHDDCISNNLHIPLYVGYVRSVFKPFYCIIGSWRWRRSDHLWWLPRSLLLVEVQYTRGNLMTNLFYEATCWFSAWIELLRSSYSKVPSQEFWLEKTLSNVDRIIMKETSESLINFLTYNWFDFSLIEVFFALVDCQFLNICILSLLLAELCEYCHRLAPFLYGQV